MDLNNRRRNSNNRNTVKKIKLCTLNICGLSDRSKFAINKFNHDNNIEILALQETGTSDNNKLNLDNMSMIHDSNLARNRGTALYVNNKHSLTKLDSISSIHLDSCWGLVNINNKRLIVGNVYVKLNTKNAITEVLKMLKAAHQKQTQLKAVGIILTGDFNARHISWGDSICNNYGKELFSSLDTTKFSICTSSSPTFLSMNGSSHIDMSIISHDLIDSVESCITDNEAELFSGAPIRGHVPLLTDIVIRSHFTPTDVKEKLDITKMNWEKWKSGIERKIDESSEFFESQSEPYPIWTKLNNIIQENTDLHCSTKRCSEHSKPYWTESLSTLSKSLQHARKCYVKRNTDDNFQKLNEARESFDSERKTVCQQFLINKAKSLNSAQSLRFWKEFNKIFKKKTTQKVDPLDDEDGGYITDQVEVEETLFSVFFEAKHLTTENFDDGFYREVTNIYEDIMEQMSEQGGVTADDDSHDTSLNKEFTVEEIIQAIKATPSSGKSVDNFNFHPQMFNNLGSNAVHLLKKLFNLCLSKQLWVWEIAEVIFLRKDGKTSYSKPGSYRPICITSYIGKLLERIIVRRVEAFMIINNLVDPDQEGFSAGKNTVRYLNRLHLDIQTDKEALKTVICLFIDFEKAFDSVWKKGLIVKLKNMGIQGSILKLIENFLLSRKVTLNINGVIGNLRQCSDYGLPQGSVISPLLFKIYVGDFLSELNDRPDINLYKFADDGTIKTSASDSLTCVHNLKEILNSLSAWTKKWRMKVNCNRNKTEYIVFNTAEGNKELVPKSFKLDDKDIHLVNQTKVLGLTIDEDLTYIPHSDDVLNSLNAKWATLCKFSNRYWGFNVKVMTSLIKALFLSKLSYASHIWMSKENMKAINSLWYKIIKAVTGAVFNIKQNLAELIIGIPPIPIQASVNSIKHFLKLNIKPIPDDRYKEFITATYNEVQKVPSTLHLKFKEIFNFLQWKSSNFPSHFSQADIGIVETKAYSQFFCISSKACSYSKEIMNKYIEEVLWNGAIRNQFQLEGYPTSPRPSCKIIPIPTNTPRETEVKLLSVLYKNNLLNSALYKLGKTESPLCTLCGNEEETARHILFHCASVDYRLRHDAITEYHRINEDIPELSPEDSFIGFLNAIKDVKFVTVCINILSQLPIRTSIEL